MPAGAQARRAWRLPTRTPDRLPWPGFFVLETNDKSPFQAKGSPATQIASYNRARIIDNKDKDMSIEANKALARRYMQAVVDGDIATVEALQHPDVSWWILGFGTLDKKAFTDSVRGLIAARERNIRITGLTAEGDRVAVQAEGEIIYPDGKIYRNSYHNLLVIQGGLIVEGREYMDTRAVEAAFAQ